MRILVIDDERIFTQLENPYTPSEFRNVFYAKTFESAQYFLPKEHWDLVYLDHDLGEDKSGYDICLEIEKLAYEGKLLNVDYFVIHSMNPIGRMRMYHVLSRFYNVRFARVEDLL